MASSKTSMYILMSLLVVSWGLEFVFGKQVLTVMTPQTLTFFKYTVALVIVSAVKIKLDPGPFIRKQDIPTFLISSGIGIVAYFYCEYKAMDYIPVAILTIILAFVPVFSLLAEKMLYKAAITRPMVLGSLSSIIGIVLVIGADLKVLFEGRILGYLLAFLAIVCWNAYNFTTAHLHGRYTSITLTFNQQILSVLMLLPIVLGSMPDPEAITPDIIWRVGYLGIVGGAAGYLIMVKAIKVIGVTPTAIFSNFMPVTTTLFGWLILGETVSPIQLIGGVVIIASGCLVIWEKQKAISLMQDRIPETSQSEETPRKGTSHD